MASVYIFTSKSVSARWEKPAEGENAIYRVQFPSGSVMTYRTADEAIRAAKRAARRIGETGETTLFKA